MTAIRTAWLVLAVAAVWFAVSSASDPMMTVSLSCSKIGEPDCATPIVEAMGVWPLLILGITLATPPLVAALAMRPWVSWTAVTALVGAAILGLVQWTGFWSLLMTGLPMAVVALVLALLHARRVDKVRSI